MARSESTFIAIGGGGTNDSILEAFFDAIKDKSEASVAVMTVASSETNGMTSAYNSMFRKHNVKHVSMIDIEARQDALSPAALKKIEDADAIYFTGGDQLNITSLYGGSPLDYLLREKVKEGVVIAGTSAGAAMMASTMIKNGNGDDSPRVGNVETSSGLDLIANTVIDTHFAQRGRYGRLLTALAHHPHMLCIGLDEKTAIVAKGKKFRVVGEGAVTVMCGVWISHVDLPYREQGEQISIFDIRAHILSEGCSYDMKTRTPKAPAKALKKAA
ncbi:MAG: cyanophycinase [Pyrinomonadaceae bacterium]